MKHFDYIMLFIVTLLIGQSCSDKVESISEDDTDMQHHATLVLNGAIAGYESSRAQDYNWRDGDKIFLQFFTSSDIRIRGVASYNAQLDVWNLEYYGNLPSGVSAKCEAYFFDKMNEKYSAEIDLTSVYEDKSAAFRVENDVVSVFAVLSPAVGRIRLKGEPGTKFMVSGFNSITDYNVYSNSFVIKEAYINSEIGNDGYSPYFYGTFPSEENKQLNLELKSGTNASHTYTQYLDSKALSKGHSGYVTLPSEIDNNGWEEAAIKGSKNAPFTVAEAKAYTSSLAAGVESDRDVYIKGRVVSIKENFSKAYGNAAFYIADDMNASSENQFYVFRALYLGNVKYTYGDLLKEGDEVVVCGRVTNYMGNTPETVQNKAWLVSLNGKSADDSTGAIGDGTEANPYNSVAANAFAMSLGDNEQSGEVYIKGKVVSIEEQFGTPYGNASFYIADDVNVSSGNWFYVFRCFYLGNMKYTDGPLLEVGNDVVVCGKVEKYVSSYGTILETVQNKAWLVSLTSNGGSGGESGGESGEDGGDEISGNGITLDLSTLGFENATAVTDITMSDGTVLTFGNGTNTTNAPKYYTASGGVRMYANNTLNIKASGKTLIGVKLTCDSYNGSDYVGNDTLNGKSGSTTVNPSVSGTTVTFSGFSGSELLITNSYAQASGGVQLRIKTITVYYAN